jgi:hypothetical protein
MAATLRTSTRSHLKRTFAPWQNVRIVRIKAVLPDRIYGRSRIGQASPPCAVFDSYDLSGVMSEERWVQRIVAPGSLIQFLGRYCGGIELPGRSASQNTVTIHQRSPSLRS